jgi:hypothetical protein
MTDILWSDPSEMMEKAFDEDGFCPGARRGPVCIL